MASRENKLNDHIMKVEQFLDEYLVKKAPSIPQNIKQIIVKYGPWVLLILLILGAIPLLLGIPLLLAFSNGVYTIAAILSIIMVVIQALALPGLFKLKRDSWNLLFYSTLIGIVQALFVPNILLSLIITFLSLYVLFQIKSFYTK